MTARYNGLADWYDTRFGEGAEANRKDLVDLLGPGDGPCLDLGCGTGRNFDVIRSTGRSVVGVDRSADQLRLARTRTDGPLIEADATALPFGDDSFGTVAALWISTDLDDFAGAVREAARVLRPGGVLAFYGVHPCFNGPQIEYVEDGARIIHTTYRLAGWHPVSPWWDEGGIRSTVGMRHVPLADFLNAFIRSGLLLEQVMEPREDPVPHAIAVRARLSRC